MRDKHSKKDRKNICQHVNQFGNRCVREGKYLPRAKKVICNLHSYCYLKPCSYPSKEILNIAYEWLELNHESIEMYQFYIDIVYNFFRNKNDEILETTASITTYE